MAHVIAIAGKGGVGKTTLTGLIIQYLAEKGRGPILAVDADANSNLNEVLGMELEATLGDIREEVARAEMSKENPIPAGMTRMPLAGFLIRTVIGSSVWNLLLLSLGKKAGSSWYQITAVFERYSIVIVTILLLALLLYVAYKQKGDAAR